MKTRGSITYNSWRSMVARCTKPGTDEYERYGGRGVTVCDRWLSFEAFVEDMGDRPSSRHSIDRIDNARGYEPSNCRWATHQEQQRNRTNNRYLTLNGERLLVEDWAVRLSVSVSTLWTRISRGWSDERVLTTPTPERAPTVRGEWGIVFADTGEPAEHTVFSSRDEARLAIRRHRAERKCGQHAVRLARIRQRAGKGER